MLHRRQLRELTAVGQYFRDESLAFGNPLDLDRDALHRAFDPLETFGDVGGNRGRRRAAALDAPRPGARERKEHQAQHAEYDRYDEEVLSHGEFSRDDPGRGSAPAGCSPRSASSLVRKRWFSILRAHALTSTSNELPTKMVPSSAPISSGAASIIPPLRGYLRGR